MIVILLSLVWWDGEVTVQIEGIAQEVSGDDIPRAQAVYFAAFHDGRARAAWPTIA